MSHANSSPEFVADPQDAPERYIIHGNERENQPTTYINGHVHEMTGGFKVQVDYSGIADSACTELGICPEGLEMLEENVDEVVGKIAANYADASGVPRGGMTAAAVSLGYVCQRERPDSACNPVLCRTEVRAITPFAISSLA